jgi:hypothetical protein
VAHSRRRSQIALVVFAALAIPGEALAQGVVPAQDAYGGTPGQLPPVQNVAPAPPAAQVLGQEQTSVVPAPAGAPTEIQQAKPEVIASPTVPAVAPVSKPQPIKGNELPFTGSDLRIALLIGLMLLGTGLALRRVARPPGR